MLLLAESMGHPMGPPAKQATFLSAKGVPHILTTEEMECLELEVCPKAFSRQSVQPAHSTALLLLEV